MYRLRRLYQCNRQTLKSFWSAETAADSGIVGPQISPGIFGRGCRHSRLTKLRSMNCIMHVTLWHGHTAPSTIEHFQLLVPHCRTVFHRTWKRRTYIASIFNGFRDIQWRICDAMVDMTLIRPLNKGQGHSFWYQSISHMRLPICCQ